MKTWIALLGILFLGSTSVVASENHYPTHYGNYYNGQSYIFVEQGIEFSIFPDGQFDFVFVGGNTGTNVSFHWQSPGVNVSFNSGYNYDMYVQYDDYGAVVQVENVPIYYDHYGRIVQAGNVEIRYNDRRIVRVGGMRIHYNSFGYYTHFTGFVSPFYTTYIYRPWHVYYVPPVYGSCIVYSYPYRRYYRPVRYDYGYHYRNYNRGRRNYTNGRRDFYRPGSRIHQRDGRVVRNTNYRSERKRSDRELGRINPKGNNNSRPMVADKGDRTEKPRTTRYEKPRANRSDKTRVTRSDKGRPANNNSTVDRGVPKERSDKANRIKGSTNNRSDRGSMTTTSRKTVKRGTINNGSRRETGVKKNNNKRNYATTNSTVRKNKTRANSTRGNSPKKQQKQSTRSRRGL